MILSDLLVIELASVLAGPSLGMFLAEQGATVIKVENPHSKGDVTRGWRLASESQKDDRSAYFCSVNWGKQSICLDIKDKDDRQKVKGLIAKADIVITSFRPGQAGVYGLDYESLIVNNPRLIVAEISGYGPDDSRPAFDAIIQAETGFTYLNGPARKGQEKMPVALMDILAAHQLKEGVLLALIRRGSTGKGGRVAVDLLSSGLASLANQATNYLTAGVAPQPMGSAHPNIAPYGEAYETATGPVVLAVGNDKQFEMLCSLLEWEAPKFLAKNIGRVQNRENLNRELRSRMQPWERDGLLTELARRGVPAGPINSISEAMDLPNAQELLLQADGRGGLRSFVARMGESPVPLRPPPHLNEHHDTIMMQYLV